MSNTLLLCTVFLRPMFLRSVLCGWLLMIPVYTANAAVGLPASTPSSAFPAIKNTDLTSVAQQVLDKHPRIQAARAALNAIRARGKAANQALYNPELELDTEKTAVRTSYIQLSQTLDMGDQRGSRTDVATAEMDQANAEFELVAQGIVRDLLTSLAERHTLQELAQLAKRTRKLMQDFSRIATRRHQAGDLNQVELDLALLALSEAQINYVQAQADATSARENLRTLLGTLPETLPDLPESLPAASLPADREMFFQSLPSIRAHKARVTVARHVVDLRRSERSWDPTISLRGGEEGQESMVGMTLSIPLNIRNTFRAEVQAALQDLIQQEQSAQAAYRTQRATVLASTERFHLLQQAWQSWRQSGQVSVRRQLQLIERLWRSGDMGTTEYLVQLKQAIGTQAAGIELRGRLWQSGFNWLYETARINTWLNLNQPIEY